LSPPSVFLLSCYPIVLSLDVIVVTPPVVINSSSSSSSLAPLLAATHRRLRCHCHGLVICVPRCLLLVPVVPFIPGRSWRPSFLSSLPLLSSLSSLSPLPWSWSSSVSGPSSSCPSSPGPGVILSSSRSRRCPCCPVLGGGCPRGSLWPLSSFRLPRPPGPVRPWCWGVRRQCCLALFPSFHCCCRPEWVGLLVVRLVTPSRRGGSSVACCCLFREVVVLSEQMQHYPEHPGSRNNWHRNVM
jgi:hypothetical protein